MNPFNHTYNFEIPGFYMHTIIWHKLLKVLTSHSHVKHILLTRSSLLLYKELGFGNKHSFKSL